MSSGRKRVVSSCKPCYTRKQKCNREYPCNHCARRRRPEECAYYTGPLATQTTSPPECRKEEVRSDKERRASSLSLSLINDWTAPTTSPASTFVLSNSSLTEVFGYFEDSDSNTLALIRKLGFGEDVNHQGSSIALAPNVADKVHHHIDRVPDRQILDFLVQYFGAEVTWMDQLVHFPWFLSKYQRWWTVDRVTLVMEVDFAVLILRICSYASLFLPSPSYTLDKIRGVSLADIRSTCDDIADNLSNIISALDSQGSLIRVQHLAFHGLRCQTEGRQNAFWEALSRAIRVAQSVGIHSDATNSRQGVDEIDKELRRRTFCNLYIWDSLLARQLDRVAFLPDRLSPDNWPRVNLARAGDGINTPTDMPEFFTERLLQARLADFWRIDGPVQGSRYDMVEAEERYERFCREYLSKLPSPFALQPCETWDKRLTKLPMKRQLLHIAVYDSLCWNFRPLLAGSHDHGLPTYKRVLLGAQKKALAVAALGVLDCVSQLHALLGGCHTRFSVIVFSTFDAAVILGYLCTDPLFPGSGNEGVMPDLTGTRADPLRAGMSSVTRNGCLQAIQGALSRLHMLAEVSNMAEVAAGTLARIWTNVFAAGVDEMASTHSQEVIEMTNCQLEATSAVGDETSWLAFDSSDLNSLDDFVSVGAPQDLQSDWTTPVMDCNY